MAAFNLPALSPMLAATLQQRTPIVKGPQYRTPTSTIKEQQQQQIASSGQIPYQDLLYGSRGDSLWTMGPNGPTAVSGQAGAGNVVPTNEDTTFRATPGYDFRFGEGQRALENSLVSRGLGLSGRAAKEATRYGQDYGAAEYQNVFNRRASIAGIMPPAVSNMNQAGSNFAGNVGNAQMNAGNAQASAYMNQGQALNSALQGGIQNYLFNQYMQPPAAQTSSPMVGIP